MSKHERDRAWNAHFEEQLDELFVETLEQDERRAEGCGCKSCVLMAQHTRETIAHWESCSGDGVDDVFLAPTDIVVAPVSSITVYQRESLAPFGGKDTPLSSSRYDSYGGGFMGE